MLAGCGGSQPPINASALSADDGYAAPFQHTFKYTGGEQTFKVRRA
jgi:hypothetical protein